VLRTPTGPPGGSRKPLATKAKTLQPNCTVKLKSSNRHFMKKNWFVSFFILFFSASLLAQSFYVPKHRLFEKGLSYYKQSKLDSAILCWEDILIQYKETEPVYGQAMLNLGVVCQEKKEVEKAKKWYKTMLTVELDDFAPGFEANEQYASYKHNACMRLATLLGGEGQYRQALSYVNLAQNKHTYKTESGTRFEYRSIVLTKWQSTYYNKLNKPDSALFVLVHKNFDTEIAYRLPTMTSFGNTEGYYEAINKMALELIDKQKGGRSEFKKRLDKSLENITLQVKEGINYSSFNLDGLLYTLGSASEATKQTFVNQIKATPLYSAISELNK
jgi:tetratricopeptide (TPR) repeat protein